MMKNKIKQLFSFFTIFCFLGFAFFCGILFFFINHPVVDFSLLEHYQQSKPSILLDDLGQEWGRFQLDKREPVSIEHMPLHLVNAFIASEDHMFFEHTGISLKGILRSALINIYHGKIVQGASTITQQLVKLLFFDSRRTFYRKVREQFLALLVERQFTKEQILETYLNHVYFGCGIYGVEAASQRFWGKCVEQLTIDESALLAAIVKSPGWYCPLFAPLSAEKRRKIVLDRMLQLHYISENEYQKAIKNTLHLISSERHCLAPHLQESIRIFLEELFGKEKLYSGGLQIQTTLNKKAQQCAERHFAHQFNIIRKKIMDQADGGFISIDVSSGAIKAVIGGVSFDESQYNRALKATRQLGSVFKPVIYAAALESGLTFQDTFIDEPFSFCQDGCTWTPKNVYNTFEGQMTLARALSSSNNIITIKTLLSLDSEKVVDYARRFGIATEFYPSLALGCIDITLNEAAAIFNVFANDGIYVEPYFLQWVKDEWGKKIWRNIPIKRRAISSCLANQIAQVLTLGIERLRKKVSYQWIKSESISKTGTTNDARTCWWAASTPDTTTAIYVGCDDNRSLGKNVFPVHTCFPIWLGYQRDIETSEKKFEFDPSLEKVKIDGKTGKILENVTQPEGLTILINSQKK